MNVILKLNKSKCCNAEVQLSKVLSGGMGGYTDYYSICLKCNKPLDEDEIIYLGKIYER